MLNGGATSQPAGLDSDQIIMYHCYYGVNQWVALRLWDLVGSLQKKVAAVIKELNIGSAAGPIGVV